MKLYFNKTDNKAKLRQDYLNNGYVKLEHALTNETARFIHEKISNQKQWNLVFKNKGFIKIQIVQTLKLGMRKIKKISRNWCINKRKMHFNTFMKLFPFTIFTMTN